MLARRDLRLTMLREQPNARNATPVSTEATPLVGNAYVVQREPLARVGRPAAASVKLALFQTTTGQAPATNVPLGKYHPSWGAPNASRAPKVLTKISLGWENASLARRERLQMTSALSFAHRVLRITILCQAHPRAILLSSSTFWILLNSLRLDHALKVRLAKANYRCRAQTKIFGWIGLQSSTHPRFTHVIDLHALGLPHRPMAQIAGPLKRIILRRNYSHSKIVNLIRYFVCVDRVDHYAEVAWTASLLIPRYRFVWNARILQIQHLLLL